MGCFDSVYVGCKRCGNTLEFQSKADDCCQMAYNLSTCPPKIVTDLDGEIQECPRCGLKTKLHLVNTPRLRAELYEEDGFDVDKSLRIALADNGWEK